MVGVMKQTITVAIAMVGVMKQNYHYHCGTDQMFGNDSNKSKFDSGGN
jgi:hypothetical protein